MPGSRYKSICLLHGKGGGPGGSVSQLETLLRESFPEAQYSRPSLPHGREKGVQAAGHSLDYLRELPIEPGSLLIGISLGGLVAARLQETGREDLHVICISSPVWGDDVELQRKLPHRLALYSSGDEVIAGRTSRWPDLAEAHDLPWLTHNTDSHKKELIGLLVPYMSHSGNEGMAASDRDAQQAFDAILEKVLTVHADLFRRLAEYDREQAKK